jgi:hypothetical protein
MQQIEIYADENLRQYSLISKQMPDLQVDTEINENTRDLVVNNPQTLEDYKNDLFRIDENNLILKNNTEEFVKVNGEIYESVAKQGNLNHFVKLETPTSDYYAVEVKAPQTNLKLSDYSYLNESPEKFKRIKDLYKPKKQEIVKDKNFMLAPNGKPTNLSEENWIYVRTPEFKAWFGDWQNDPQNASKVVDENGEPLVVYHGTNNFGFKEFKSNEFIGNLIFFSEEKKGAEPFAYAKGSGIYEAFINVKNPYKQEEIFKSTEEIETAKKAKKYKKDGFKVADFSMYSGFAETNWAIFEPNQIQIINKNLPDELSC